MNNPLKQAFIGLDTHYPLADGRNARRIYLDSAASSLMLKPASDTVQEYLRHYANTHTSVHTSAHITSKTIAWAHQQVLDFVCASPKEYISAFLGSGTTAVANRIATGLTTLRPQKDVVLISSMEHHSNDLPHRVHAQKIEHIPLHGEGQNSGQISLQGLEKLLQQYQERVNYVAVSGVSNVTGIINPLQKIAELSHRFDALLVVDGAQMVAHMPININQLDIDCFMFSGHKVYAPGSPGVLVAKSELIKALQPTQYGGGMVGKVSKWNFNIHTDLIEREQAGTPNIPGAIALACVLKYLDRLGMDTVYAQETELTQWTLEQLATCRSITIYGEHKNLSRIASIAFNLKNIGHGLVAAILNDYHGIAVRNECFCAHPYVHELLKEDFEELASIELDNAAMEKLFQDRRGMVRVSFGLYTTKDDIQALVLGLKDVEDNIATYKTYYALQEDGSYRHKTFHPEIDQLFDIEHELFAQLDID